MNFCIVSIILYSLIILYRGYLSTAGPSSRKAILKVCDLPTLKNGLPRLRQNRRLIKFQCNKSYTLIGSIYAGCVGGKWDTQFPVCAKAGCENVESRKNGFIAIQHSGLMASLFCENKYKVAGVQTAYCNGSRWDRPIGSCRASTTNSTSCDFEVEDLCGWTHDNTHDFEWKRVVGTDNLKQPRTGPQHDHTTMIPNAGHYMLVESINQLPDDRARLISPVFSPKTVKCLRFYYHMYGHTVGTLRVYIKPNFIGFDSMLKDDSFILFEISGNRGNLWHEKIVQLVEMADDFQIIFEGTAGTRHLSDIAIDDVTLLNKDECRKYKNEDQQENDEDGITSTEQGQIIFDVQSCKNRCNETVPTNESVILSQQGLVKTCDCHPDCEITQTCCNDFRTLCVFGINYSEGDDGDIEYSTKSQLQSQSTIELKSSTTPLIKTTFQLETSTEQPNLIEFTSTLNQKTVEFTTFVETLETTTSIILENVTTSENLMTTPKLLTTSSYDDDISYAILSTTNGSVETFENNSWDTYEVIPSWKEWEINASMTKHRDWMPAWVIILLGVLTTGAILSLLVFLILYYRKHYGPGNYKKNGQSATSKVNEEFSEVRFLTCDEHLDFTLQTPEIVGNLQK